MGHTGNNLARDGGDADSTRLSPSDAALLSRYLDGDFNKTQQAALENRMTNDTALRQEADALRALQTALRTLPAPADAGSAKDRVFIRLERTARLEAAQAHCAPSTSFFGRGRMLAAGLAAATVAGLVFLIPGSNVTPEASHSTEAFQAARPGTQVPLPEVDEMETLARLHDAQNATVVTPPASEETL